MKLKISLVFICSILLLSNFGIVSGTNIENQETREDSIELDYIPGEVIVKFSKGVNEKNCLKVSDINSFEGRQIKRKINEFNSAVITVEEGSETDFINYVKSKSCPYSETIRYAELNYIPKVEDIPNDPEFENQWALNNELNTKDIDIDFIKAYHYEDGSSVTDVAVIDQGVNYNHPDLRNNFRKGYSPFGGDCMDIEGHGTKVAGIIAAETNNGVGIAGIAQVDLLAVRASKMIDGKPTLTTEACADGIRWAADNGADIICMSWGISGPSNILKDACDYAFNKDCLLVASAGNKNYDLSEHEHYPSGYSNVIAVGGVDLGGNRFIFLDSGSNYGGNKNSNGVELVAPAWGIISTNKYSDYSTISATSSAAPHVAGVAALVHSCDSSLSNLEIRSILRNSAKSLGSDPDNEFGYGLVKATDAIDQVLDIPKLKVEGNLNFGEVKRGETETRSITIKNVGEEDSNLYWAMDNDFPNSGGWQVRNEEGVGVASGNIRGKDQQVINVIFTAGDDKETDFSGNIKVYNGIYPLEYENLGISGRTLKEKNMFFSNIFERCSFLDIFLDLLFKKEVI